MLFRSVDDVISTGESLAAMEALVKTVGGNIVGKMAALAEGEAATRDDIIYLEKLPLFNGKGEVPPKFAFVSENELQPF